MTCKGLPQDRRCPEGKIPYLSPENCEVWNLFIAMIPGLERKDGWDYTAIQVVFDCHGIEQERRPRLLEQIVVLIQERQKARA